MSIAKLLGATVRVGGSVLRLVPGRQIVVVTPQGERTVQGPLQSAVTIEELLAPIMTADARDRLASEPAEWIMTVPGVGAVRAHVEAAADGPHATFTLEVESGASGAPPEDTGPRPRDASEMDALLRLLARMKGSDLHISAGCPPMVRIDGGIEPIPGRPALTDAETRSLVWQITPERNRAEFTLRHDTDFAHEIPGLARFRCNLFLDRKGVGGVFRVIPNTILSAEEMGLSKEILQLCHLPKGLVLVTGPTGSGKSTTLAALVDYVNRNRTDHIITIEDPIEFVHENKRCIVHQRQVGEHTDTFKGALRAALREDPDVMMVGEMRDLETVAIAIETAETGHLVFGTLHTSSASTTIDRVIDQFPADHQAQIRVMLAESLKGVISQTLCRRIGGGRVPAFEVLIGIPAISNLIREAKAFQIPSIMQTGRKYGMYLMNESLLDLVKKGLVEPQEAYAKAPDKSGLLAMFKRSNVDTAWAGAEPPA